MQKMLVKFKQPFLVHSISFLFASLSWIKNDTLFRWFYTLLSFLNYGAVAEPLWEQYFRRKAG